MGRHHILVAVVAVAVAGCYQPPSAYPSYPSYFQRYAPVYVPAYVAYVPLAAFPPAPFPYASLGPDSMYQSRAPVSDVQFETPSLAVRNLALKISESASSGDCATARQTGDELERVDADSHHAILAVDERYAQCVRGF